MLANGITSFIINSSFLPNYFIRLNKLLDSRFNLTTTLNILIEN